jgi:outer membrane protein assembly factor BamB
MKFHRYLWFCIALVLVAVAGIPQVQQGNTAMPPPPLNPNAIALLRWYRMNQVAQIAVPGPIHAAAIAFDGADMWITGIFESTVTKVRASDGAVLGTFNVGSNPDAVAFDGANVLVANGVGTVTKLRASDGAVLGTFTVGNNPQGITFDGAHIWVANASDNTVMKLRASDGKVLGTFAVTGGPGGMAFDGANVWVGSNSGTVTKLRASDGTILGTFSVCQPVAMAFDGTNMWITNYSCATVTKLRASDGTNLGTFATGGDLPTAVAFDGQFIWVGNSGSSPLNSNVVKLRLSDGAIAAKTPIGQGAYGAAFDGANVWVTAEGTNIFKM